MSSIIDNECHSFDFLITIKLIPDCHSQKSLNHAGEKR